MRFDIPFEEGTVFSKIVVDMDFFHGGWGGVPSHNHNIFWLNRGNSWPRNVFG